MVGMGDAFSVPFILSCSSLISQIFKIFLKTVTNHITWLIHTVFIQSNLSKTDTEGTEQSVRIREVSV